MGVPGSCPLNWAIESTISQQYKDGLSGDEPDVKTFQLILALMLFGGLSGPALANVQYINYRFQLKIK
jgi:hypothetical protein